MMASIGSPLSFIPSPAINERAVLSSHSGANRSAMSAPPLNRSTMGNGPHESARDHGWNPLSPLTSPGLRPRGVPTSPQARQSRSPPPFDVLYSDHYRKILDEQRHVFEQERAVFNKERVMWDLERQELKTQIELLQRALAAVKGGGEVLSNGSTVASPTKENLSSPRGQLLGKSYGLHKESSGKSTTSEPSSRFWEGGFSQQGMKATRVFSDSQREDNKLPTISEDQPSNNATTPIDNPPVSRTHGPPVAESPKLPPATVDGGYDISVIDKDLEGIRIRASAVPKSVLAKLRPPSPPKSPPTPTFRLQDCTSPKTSNQHKPFTASGDETYLTKNAGHTPLALSSDLEASSNALTSPTEEVDEPNASLAANTEGNKSVAELDDDPELRGHLILPTGGEEADDIGLLKELDSRLLEEARKAVRSNSSSGAAAPFVEGSAAPAGHAASSDAEHKAESALSSVEVDHEPEIKLRFKRSMNFGSAFGSASLRDI